MHPYLRNAHCSSRRKRPKERGVQVATQAEPSCLRRFSERLPAQSKCDHAFLSCSASSLRQTRLSLTVNALSACQQCAIDALVLWPLKMIYVLISRFIYVYLSIYLVACLSVCLVISIFLFIYVDLCTYLPICLFVNLSVILSVYVFIYLSVYLSLYIYRYLSIYPEYIHLSVCLFICMFC